MNHSSRNPFSGVDAAKLDPEQILDYWCSPFNYRLFSSVKEQDIFGDENNIIFMGGRSSGKSMFLRYWSYPVQTVFARRHNRTLLDVMQEAGGVGVYQRIDLPRLNSFRGHGFDSDHWNATFTHYFELNIGRQYIELLHALEMEQSVSQDAISGSLLSRLSELLHVPPLASTDAALEELDAQILQVERFLSDVPFDKQPFRPRTRAFDARSLSFGIPELFAKYIPAFGSLAVIILLDEYENYSEAQQLLVNSILRFSKRRIKFRIGMRLEGFKTYRVNSADADDFIKEGREYRQVVFEEILNKDADYHSFLAEISRRRLEMVPAFSDRGFTDIRGFLGAEEDLEKETVEFATDDPNRITEYFCQRFPRLADQFQRVRCDDRPLLELLNFVWLTRGVSVDATLQAMRDYLVGVDSDAGRKYRRDYIDKYKLSLTFLLCSIFHKPKLYYSFNTFAFLSSGIIGHFIELCRRSFAIADVGDKDELLGTGVIRKEFQNRAAVDLANSEKLQIGRIETYGAAISRFVENIGNVFRQHHADLRLRYPETNQFALNLNGITDTSVQGALRAAIKWSVVQKKPAMQRPGPSEATLRDIYTISRVFSPAFQISYRTRGGRSLPLDEFALKQLMNSEGVAIGQFLKPDTHEDSKDTAYPGDLFDGL